MKNHDNNLLDLDRKYIWHPYTQMKDYKSRYHILIKKAKGMKIYDHRGRYYYDTISSWWCNILGHNIPRINRSIKKQIRKFEHVLFAGFTNKNAVILAQKLVKMTHPALEKVFYTDDGATSIEAALKLSYQYWQNIGIRTKKKFVFLDNSYHGDTIGAMSVSGASQFNNIFKELFFKSYNIPSPYCYRCPVKKKPLSCDHECLLPLKKLLKERAKEISGIILEPLIQGAGGMIIYPASYLDKLYDIVKKYQIHIILDEIAVGFGRTGKMFAYQHSGIRPDFICLSKALTNGTLPLGAVLTTRKVYDAFYGDYHENKTFFHGHTFTGNPISTGVALTTLDIIEKKNLLGRVESLSSLLNDLLTEKIKDIEYIGDLRQAGLVAAMEIVKDKQKKKLFPEKERIGWKVYLEGLKHNLILRPLGNVVYFYFPLTITASEIEIITSKFQDVMKKVFN